MLAAAAAVAAAVAGSAQAQAPPTPASVLAAMDAADNYFTGHNDQADCGWTRATYYAGAIAHYHSTCAGANGCNATLLSFITGWAEAHNYSCGGSINANDECCGATYTELYELAPSADKLALTATLDKPHPADSLYWIDASFMAVPTFMRFANVTGNTTYADRIFTMFTYAADTIGLWSPVHNLFYRDATYFNKTSPNGLPVFWSRGNGWAIAAMARGHAALPAGSPYALEFAQKLQAISTALTHVQGDDGFWRANLLDSDEFPNPETTGTSMFTFGMAWGINNGVLPRDDYAPIVLKAWNGLATLALQPDGLVGWCQPANGQPAPTVQNSTSDFCVGQFLLAGSEVMKMVS